MSYQFPATVSEIVGLWLAIGFCGSLALFLCILRAVGISLMMALPNAITILTRLFGLSLFGPIVWMPVLSCILSPESFAKAVWDGIAHPQPPLQRAFAAYVQPVIAFAVLVVNVIIPWLMGALR